MKVFVIGDGRSFLIELVTFRACSCSLWCDGYPVVGLSASSIPMLAANGTRRRSNQAKKIEGIEVFCSTNALDNAAEALLQVDALLRDVVAFSELFHTEDSVSDNFVDVLQAVQNHHDILQHTARPRGRPQIHLSEQQLTILLELYFSIRDMAALLQV